MLERFDGRNGSGEFARRSMKNLDFIVQAARNSADVHPVTQTVTALLAIIVFPWQRAAFAEVKKKRLAIAARENWPSFQMSGPRMDANEVKTIGDLITQLRHSVAHGHVSFDSDSRAPADVNITFRNQPSEQQPPEWQGVIRADHLAVFCRMFSAFIEDYVA
jgi:hypothetical protein